MDKEELVVKAFEEFYGLKKEEAIKILEKLRKIDEKGYDTETPEGLLS